MVLMPINRSTDARHLSSPGSPGPLVRASFRCIANVSHPSKHLGFLAVEYEHEVSVAQHSLYLSGSRPDFQQWSGG